MNKKKAKIVMVIDKSGSMGFHGKRHEAISGFNRFLADQQKVPGEATLTICLFNTHYQIVRDNVVISAVDPWTEEDYVPGGMTALNDAVGHMIDETGRQLSNTAEADRPGVVVFAVLTDGLENISREYTGAMIAEKIKHQTEKYNWKFIYLGNNLDTSADHLQAKSMNFTPDAIYTSGAAAGAIGESYGIVSERLADARIGLSDATLEERLAKFKERKKEQENT